MIVRKGHYSYRVHMRHRPLLGWLLIGLAVLLVIKALPLILLLVLAFAGWQFWSRRACCDSFDFGWRDSMSEKPKRKNKNRDRWDDDAPIIV